MKKFILVLAVYCTFVSCQEASGGVFKNNSSIEKVKDVVSTDTLLSKPPTDNPIMLQFFVVKKNLNKADEVYRKYINEAKSLPYYDNLRQYGFQALIKHGLIENGTREQKLFYITEQLNSVANLANISEFYALLTSGDKSFTKDESINFGKRFYLKNLNLIENELEYSSDEIKTDRILKLKMNYKVFNRKVQLMKD